MAYAAVNQLQGYLPQEGPKGDLTQDELDVQFQDALDRATDLVQGELGNVIRFLHVGETWQAAGVKTVFSEASQWLKLPAYKEGSITLFLEAGTTTVPPTWEERWSAGRYYLYCDEGWKADRYTVTAVWGYGPPPPKIVEVTLECAVNIWRMKDRGMFQEVQPSATGGSGYVKFIGGLTAQQKAIIENEKRVYRDGIW